MRPAQQEDEEEPLDLRVFGVGAAAWTGALGALTPGRWWAAGLLVVAAVVVVRRRWTGRGWLTPAAWCLAATAAFGSAVLHADAVSGSPVAALAQDRAAATVVVELRTDPVRVQGRFGTGYTADAELVRLTARGTRWRVHADVQLRLPASAAHLQRGSTLRVVGLLAPAFRVEQAAVLSVNHVQVVAGPGPLTSAANRLRRAVRDAVAHRSTGARALVPALVDGEAGGMAPEVVEDFRTTGLTHLLAVSGTNLTIVVGCLLVIARWIGLRARALIGVGILGVGGFLLLTGTQPSVLRAAAMGTIALIGLGSGGRQRGVRALGTGILVLVVLDPWLALSIGFALSVVATAGILLLAPGWRDALTRWLPRWAAEMIAVPLAAQIACTPLVAAISGQVSLVAVVANVVAAPLVGPATVLGLLGGVLALLSIGLGRLAAAPAAWAADALIAIARHGAALPVPAVAWSTGAASLLGLLILCVAVASGMRHLLVRRWATLVAAGLMVLGILVPLPTPGWPPPGWVLIACSIGQGDGLVLRVAEHSAVVVDAGPDPRAMDRCLDRLAIRTVPVVVLTHFHADHVDGLPGVLDGRRVGEIAVSPLAEPGSGESAVRREAAAAGVPVRIVVLGESTTVGPLRWQVLAPLRTSYPDSDSPPNDASVVLLVAVRNIQILMMGDQERPSQADLRRTYPDLHADVLKVAHHGSSKQDDDLVRGLGARLAVISVGLGNDYGHPAGSTLHLLEQAGMQVRRTDHDGDVAVVVSGSGALSTVVLGAGR